MTLLDPETESGAHSFPRPRKQHVRHISAPQLKHNTPPCDCARHLLGGMLQRTVHQAKFLSSAMHTAMLRVRCLSTTVVQACWVHVIVRSAAQVGPLRQRLGFHRCLVYQTNTGLLAGLRGLGDVGSATVMPVNMFRQFGACWFLFCGRSREEHHGCRYDEF